MLAGAVAHSGWRSGVWAETVDPALYARLTGAGGGRRTDRPEAWRTTLAAAQMALDRAGMVPDVVVPPVIREVLDTLGRGVPVPAGRWREVLAAHLEVLMAGAGLRPGRWQRRWATRQRIRWPDIAAAAVAAVSTRTLRCRSAPSTDSCARWRC